jgi:hypothetical protein
MAKTCQGWVGLRNTRVNYLQFIFHSGALAKDIFEGTNMQILKGSIRNEIT